MALGGSTIHVAAPVTLDPPHQLPPQAAVLKGRDAQLEWLVQALKTQQRVALVGPGGVGKTALAAAALLRLAPQADPYVFYAGGILMHDFYGPRSLQAVLNSWLSSLTPDPTRFTDADAVRQEVVRGLKQLQPLIYLEGGENAEDLPGLLDLIEQTGSRVVLTTRHGQQAREMTRLDVETLDDEAARALYAYHAKLYGDEDDLGALCETLGRLPLALQIMGASNQRLPPSEVIEIYSFDDLNNLSAAERGRRRIPVIVERALAKASQDQPQVSLVFHRLGWFANQPVPRDLLAVAAATEEHETLRALRALQSHSLVRDVASEPHFHEQKTRWQCHHALIYAMARHGEVDAASFERYLRHLNQFVVTKGNEGWSPGGYRTLDAVLPHVEYARQLVSDTLGEEHPDTAASLNNLAGLYESQGRYAEAEPLYEQALAVYQQVLGEEHTDTAASLNNLAFLYGSHGRYAEAEPLYEQALAV
ncbi:MAG: tetratricopeptide repeat protein, partial [Bacteroidota bacterium]